MQEIKKEITTKHNIGSKIEKITALIQQLIKERDDDVYLKKKTCNF